MKNWVNFRLFPLLFLVMIIGFTSCDSFKKIQKPTKPTSEKNKDDDKLDEIQGKRVFNPETGEYEVVTDVTGELDTIQWKDAPEDTTVPPITSDATEIGGGSFDDTQMLGSYNMVIALPFLANRYDPVEDKIDRRSIPALNFYEGAKMAFDVLSGEGISLNVNVFDTEAFPSPTIQLTNKYEVQDAHLILGTFRNSTAEVMANFAKQNKTTFVSPFYPHQNLTAQNEYFIQINPSEKTHAEAIMAHVKEKFQPRQIVIFGRNDAQERRLMNYYQEAHFAIEGSTIADSIQMVIIDDESPSLDNTDFEPYMDEIATTAFIITSSSQSAVYAMLRKIDLVKDNKSVVVYGQPRWKDFTQIGYEIYESLNVHISSDLYLNQDDTEVQSFKEGFYNKYGMPPTDEAFKGYDMVLYFGRMLNEFGTGFRHRLDQNPKVGLHTKLDIQRTVTTPRTGGLEGEALNSFDQYMNKYLNILEFSGYQFRKAD